jgi:hypothetical protein
MMPCMRVLLPPTRPWAAQAGRGHTGAGVCPAQTPCLAQAGPFVHHPQQREGTMFYHCRVGNQSLAKGVSHSHTAAHWALGLCTSILATSLASGSPCLAQEGPGVSSCDEATFRRCFVHHKWVLAPITCQLPGDGSQTHWMQRAAAPCWSLLSW